MKISTRERRVLLGGGLAVLAILAGVYVVEPFVATQRGMRDEVQAQSALLAKHQLLASEKARYQRRVEALRAQLQQADSLLFKGEKLPVVAAEVQGLLHTLAQEAGITIVRENVRPPTKVDVFTEVAVELSVQGEMKNIRDFLYKIQTAPKLVTTPKLVIRSMPTRGATALAADLVVTGHILNGEDKGPAAAPAAGKAEGRLRPEKA